MNELIKIGNQEITTKEFKNQRVVTFEDIDLVHERPKGTAKRNFAEIEEGLSKEGVLFLRTKIVLRIRYTKQRNNSYYQ